jgi:hypothetical protein
MKTTELKNSIIKKVLKTKDNQLLDFLDQLLNEKTNEEPYLLTDFEKSIIAESQAEYHSGKVISNEEVFAKNAKWLKE